MPKVTVVIPVYNSEAYIGEALASVRDQDLRGVEVVMVDDGSTDGTVEAAERFVDSMELRIIRQRNAGPAAARNNGVRAAKSPYCAFLDSDDVMMPTRLAEQVALFDSDPALGLVHCDLMTFDSNGIIHRSRRAFSDPSGGYVLDRLLLDNFITTSTVMAPTERLIEAGLFDEGRRLSEDFDLWLRIAARWKTAFIERPLVRYRSRGDSLSADKLRTSLAALDVIESFWRENAELAAREPRLRRKSVAAHLRTAAAAAIAHGRQAQAVRYLLRALRHEPASGDVWKQAAKLVAQPLRRASGSRARGSSGDPAAT